MKFDGPIEWKSTEILDILKYDHLTLLHFCTFKQSSRRNKSRRFANTRGDVRNLKLQRNKKQKTTTTATTHNFKSAKCHLLHITLVLFQQILGHADVLSRAGGQSYSLQRTSIAVKCLSKCDSYTQPIDASPQHKPV